MTTPPPLTLPLTSPLTLALSTSSPALSIALFDGSQLLARRHDVIGRGHAEALVPAVAGLLGDVRSARIPTRILVDIGPGSYTGIRIGIAAARALGLAWGADVHGMCALSLVAARAFADDPALAAVMALIDAGRGQAAGALMRRDLVAPMPVLVRQAPAGMATAGAGTLLLPGAPLPRHDDHPDTGFAGLLSPAALGPPAALYVSESAG